IHLLPTKRPARSGEVFVAQVIEQRSTPVSDSNQSIPEDLQRNDRLDRLAELSTRINLYTTDALIVALICLGAATALRFLGSWTNSDFLLRLTFRQFWQPVCLPGFRRLSA